MKTLNIDGIPIADIDEQTANALLQLSKTRPGIASSRFDMGMINETSIQDGRTRYRTEHANYNAILEIKFTVETTREEFIYSPLVNIPIRRHVDISKW